MIFRITTWQNGRSKGTTMHLGEFSCDSCPMYRTQTQELPILQSHDVPVHRHPRRYHVDKSTTKPRRRHPDNWWHRHGVDLSRVNGGVWVGLKHRLGPGVFNSTPGGVQLEEGAGWNQGWLNPGTKVRGWSEAGQNKFKSTGLDLLSQNLRGKPKYPQKKTIFGHLTAVSKTRGAPGWPELYSITLYIAYYNIYIYILISIIYIIILYYYFRAFLRHRGAKHRIHPGFKESCAVSVFSLRNHS